MDYTDKLPPSPWYIFAPPRRYIFPPPLTTVAGWLTRLQIGRRAALEPKPPVRRYQRQRPDELLHLDIKRLARFDRVGHRITGHRHSRNKGLGYDFFHVAIDDATRLAYVEVLPDERRGSTTGFLIRALRWFRRRGISVERVMTDNGPGYSFSIRSFCSSRCVRCLCSICSVLPVHFDRLAVCGGR